MNDIISIHHENPQLRLIKRVVSVLTDNGVVVYPTDSGYALGCLLGSKLALGRVRRLLDLDKKHLFTLLCSDLSEVAKYGRMNTPAYRLLNAHTPGPYTFVLESTTDAEKLMRCSKSGTVGVRIPSHPVMLLLLSELKLPVLNVSLLVSKEEEDDEDRVVSEIELIDTSLAAQVDLIIDSGYCDPEGTTIIDLTSAKAVVLREGKGAVDAFL
jgi:tRNA threonylcarbamoyl adenosine modification protein (Sua5/YciO/YrdC/YwlC family)